MPSEKDQPPEIKMADSKMAEANMADVDVEALMKENEKLKKDNEELREELQEEEEEEEEDDDDDDSDESDEECAEDNLNSKQKSLQGFWVKPVLNFTQGMGIILKNKNTSDSSQCSKIKRVLSG